MGAESFRLAVAASRWAGRVPSTEQIEQLEALHGLLGSEGIQAGGIGPNEVGRLWSRHIADSLLFGSALANAETCVDIGSGVGLPGLPLAIVYPEVEFDLVDRSGRRCDLLRRMIAVLRLANCEVVHNDIGYVDKRYDGIVSRAAIPHQQILIHVKRLLRDTGAALIGHSWSSDEEPEMPLTPEGLLATYVTVPADILDSAVRLLRISAA